MPGRFKFIIFPIQGIVCRDQWNGSGRRNFSRSLPFALNVTAIFMMAGSRENEPFMKTPTERNEADIANISRLLSGILTRTKDNESALEEAIELYDYIQEKVRAEELEEGK